MPWCPECDRFLSPASVLTDGSCPRCGRAVDPGHAHAPESPAGVADPAAPDALDAQDVPAPPGAAPGTEPAGTSVEDEPLDPIPWHFKLLLGAVALYLGYRAFQGIEWLAGL